MIDLLQFHEVIRMTDPEKIFSVGGSMEALLAAKKAGKIRYIGFIGHKSPDIHLKMLQTAQENGFLFDTAYQNGKDARIGIGDYFKFYNTTRPHQALGYRTPGEVFNTTVFEEPEKGVIESLTTGTIDTAGHYLNLAPLLS